MLTPDIAFLGELILEDINIDRTGWWFLLMRMPEIAITMRFLLLQDIAEFMGLLEVTGNERGWSVLAPAVFCTICG